MVRGAISVEGLTEEIFVKNFLYDYFVSRNIFLTSINMGGNVSINHAKNELEKIAFNFDKVTTMYDFYGFKDKQPSDTKKSLEQKIKTSLNQTIASKVFPYVQMHEFEGLLFSSPAVIGTHVTAQSGQNVSVWAQGILNNFSGKPEDINNSPVTAPSKRLEQYTSYKKTIDGPSIARAIGLQNIRQQCPGFNAWIAMMENW